MRFKDLEQTVKLEPIFKKLTLFLPLICRDQPVKKGKRMEGKLQVNNTTKVMKPSKSLQ